MATNNVPPFDKAPYDGFAISSIDTKDASLTNPVEFEVIDHIGAGVVSTKTLGPFQVVRIMTGAQMPDGSDAVVMLELSKRIGNQMENNTYQLRGLIKRETMYPFVEKMQKKEKF